MGPRLECAKQRRGEGAQNRGSSAFKGLAGSRPRACGGSGPRGLWKGGVRSEGETEERAQGRAGAGGRGCGRCLAVGLGWGTALKGTAPVLLPLGVFPGTLGPTAAAAATCEPRMTLPHRHTNTQIQTH